MMSRWVLLPLWGMILVQPSKPDPKTAPQVLVTMPLGVAPGSTSKVTLRGLRLDAASAVRVMGSKGTVKVLNRAKVPLPNMQKAEKVGDSEVQIELSLPADIAGGNLTLEVVTPAGTSTAKVLVERGVLPEKEPNNGFRQSQAITLPAVLEGVINNPQDVDVFRFEGRAGQKIDAEIHAARLGSPLDGMLSLVDDRGSILASSDDAEGADPKISFTLPRDGVYHLSLIDAHDQGGSAFVYRLRVLSR